jgi:hypothetical protein
MPRPYPSCAPRPRGPSGKYSLGLCPPRSPFPKSLEDLSASGTSSSFSWMTCNPPQPRQETVSCRPGFPECHTQTLPGPLGRVRVISHPHTVSAPNGAPPPARTAQPRRPSDRAPAGEGRKCACAGRAKRACAAWVFICVTATPEREAGS